MSRLPHVMQLRLTSEQRRYLLVRSAASEQPMSDVVREIIDQALSRERIRVEDGDPVELQGRIPLKSLLSAIDESAIEEVARRYGS